jgi:hypothetical protein
MLITDKRGKKSTEPIRSNLMSSIKSLAETAKSDDYILFFFSGHGIEESGESYLLPSDARINVLRDTAIPIDWIKTILKGSRARAKVLILDACHASAMKGKAESGRMTKGIHDAIFPPPEGFAILSSCKLNEVSYEIAEKKHSVFTYFLMEGLQGSADFDSDGRITISDASRYTAEKTIEWSFKEGVQQTPTLECSIVGDLVLVSVPKKVRRVSASPKKTNFAVSDLCDQVLGISILFSLKLLDLESFSKRFCAFLLRYFDPNEIQFKDGVYYFPTGSLGIYIINLDYSPKNRRINEKIIMNFPSLGMQATTISYLLGSIISYKEVGKLLKASKLQALEFDPKGGFLSSFSSELKSDQNFKIMFENPSLGPSRISIETMEKEAFGDDFFEYLKPERLLKIMGDIFVKGIAKCPKCGAYVENPIKVWTLAGRPDKDGKRIQLTIGLFNCPKCKKPFRKLMSKKKI